MSLSDSYSYDLGINWNDDGSTFVDESGRLKGWTSRQGWNEELGTPQAGTLLFTLDNFDGRFTPEYASGPLFGDLEVYRRVRLRVEYNAVTYNVFYGFLTRIEPDVTTRRVQFEAVDIFHFFREMRLNLDDGGAKKTGARIQDILTDAGLTGADWDLDAGQTDLNYSPFNRTNVMDALLRCVAAELGGNLHVDGTGKVVFRDRHDRATSTSVETWTTPGLLTYDRRADRVYKRAELRAASFEDGVAGSQVWTLVPLPRAMAAGEILVLDSPYMANVKTAITPVSGTDWVANASVDGTGADKTSLVTVQSAFASYGGGFGWALQNTDSGTVYLQKCQVRGTPVLADTTGKTVTRTAASGVGPYDRTFEQSYDLVDDVNLLGAWADYIVNHFNQPRPLLRRTFRPNTDAEVASALGRQLNDRVTVVDTAKGYRTNVNGDHFIEAVEHRADVEADTHETTFSLTDFLTDQFWVLGIHRLDTTTILGY